MCTDSLKTVYDENVINEISRLVNEAGLSMDDFTSEEIDTLALFVKARMNGMDYAIHEIVSLINKVWTRRAFDPKFGPAD